MTERKTTAEIISGHETRNASLLQVLVEKNLHLKAPPQNSEVSVRIRKWSRTLLTGTAPQTEFVVTSRKQSPGKILPGAHNHAQPSHKTAAIPSRKTAPNFPAAC